MCGVPEAQMALAVVTTVAKFQNEKKIAERNEAANRVTMGNINEAYMNDLAKIDAEASRVDQAQSLEKLKMRQKLTKDQAEKKLLSLKKDLFNIRFKKINNQINNPAQYSEIKKNIARLFTTIKNSK